MKPLPCENTIWELPRSHIFIIFDTCVRVHSRVPVFLIFYRIFMILALHLGTLGTTFRDHFFRSKKYQIIVLHSHPEAGPSSTPPGEGGNWEASGRHLGDIWETSGRHLGDIWKASGRHLEGIRDTSGQHLGGSGRIWEASGKHLGGIWEASSRRGARGGPEEAGIEKVDRRLQPNAQVPFVFQF